jgi:hypothetical protein
VTSIEGRENAVVSAEYSRREFNPLAKEYNVRLRVIAVVFIMVCSSLVVRAQSDWQKKVQNELPLLGHRNWIAVVDAAYPLQSSGGIETIETDADYFVVLDYVLHQIKASMHVRALAHEDMELQFIPEKDAAGVERFRDELKRHLDGVPADTAPHQNLIEGLSTTSRTFHVLILKTKMTIPYSSVFLQLDCNYWSADSESKLRNAIKKTGRNK